jgi:hypothetical protein
VLTLPTLLRSTACHCAPGAIPKGSDKQKELAKLKQELLATAATDDAAKTKEVLSKFIAVGKIRQPSVDNIYAVNERRNLGAPTNAAVVQQTRRASDFSDRSAPPPPPQAPEPAKEIASA